MRSYKTPAGLRLWTYYRQTGSFVEAGPNVRIADNTSASQSMSALSCYRQLTAPLRVKNRAVIVENRLKRLASLSSKEIQDTALGR
jgi:hypothetical protein